MCQINNGVSIIICCYNSAQRLPETLAHLKAQIVPEHIPWEVIVVDNASTDGTGEVAFSLWRNLPGVPFRVVHEPKPGLMNARMKGFEAAQYEFVSFIDDDNWVAENWVQTVYEKMLEYPQAGAIGGRSEAVFESPPPDWFNNFKTAFAVGDQASEEGELIGGRTLWGAGLNLRKQAWLIIMNKDFLPLLSGRKGASLTAGEDSEICYAFLLSGWDLVYTPDLFFYHCLDSRRINWEHLCKMYRGFGRSDVYLGFYKQLLQQSDNGNEPERKWAQKILDSVLILTGDLALLCRAITYSDVGEQNVLRINRRLGILFERIRIIRNVRNIRQQVHETFKSL